MQQNSTLTIILSSGIVSALITLLGGLLILGKYREKVDSLEKKCEKHENKIDDMKDRISTLEGGVERDRANNPYVKRKSPLSLTDRGKAMLLDSGGESYVNANKDQLIKSIKDKNPKSAYDVQELAQRVIRERIDEDEFIPLKDFVYKEGIELKNLLQVMGIALRDAALPILGFNEAQIDESDPRRQKY